MDEDDPSFWFKKNEMLSGVYFFYSDWFHGILLISQGDMRPPVRSGVTGGVRRPLVGGVREPLVPRFHGILLISRYIGGGTFVPLKPLCAVWMQHCVMGACRPPVQWGCRGCSSPPGFVYAYRSMHFQRDALD